MLETETEPSKRALFLTPLTFVLIYVYCVPRLGVGKGPKRVLDSLEVELLVAVSIGAGN